MNSDVSDFKVNIFLLYNMEGNILSLKNNSLGGKSIRQNLFSHSPKLQIENRLIWLSVDWLRTPSVL